jgi:histidine triad (HIT) family protein
VGASDQSDCLGCRTASGAHAEDEVYRDERVVAVVAQHAVNPGHLVVVTLDHVRNALTMDEELLCHTLLVARRLAGRLREALPCSGVMLWFNNEEPCQTLFHAHLHIIPREQGDAMDVQFGEVVEATGRAAMAERLGPLLSVAKTDAAE